MPASRRTFITYAAGAVLISGASEFALADPQAVSEADPTAQSLGYKTDATQVDQTKFTTYASGKTCASCMFFKGATGGSSGSCLIFGGRLVSVRGWCTAYAQKS